MKSAFNGGLNLSVLDGWWAEGYDGYNGWAISGDVDDDHGAQDARDAASCCGCSRRRSCPPSTTATARHPTAWLAKIRAALRTCGPGFAAGRMLATTSARSTPEGARAAAARAA